MKINKSAGQTDTENYLARLCENTFLTLWSYPNPYKSSKKELCDLIAVYENHIFIFFDRESRKFDNININDDIDIDMAWKRWKKEVIDKQITSALGAERYIKDLKGKVYLNDKCDQELPILIPENAVIHKIVVAHGAENACKNYSPNNIHGSLGVVYSNQNMDEINQCPFMLNLNNQDQIHVFDSFNLRLIFKELDTFADFIAYITEKEKTIASMLSVAYAGEEDMLGMYMININESGRHYFVNDPNPTILIVQEGTWDYYLSSDLYKRKHEANKPSYLWDNLIKYAGFHVLNDTVTGNANMFSPKSAIYEMAKESRMLRRSLADRIISSIANFPDKLDNGFMSQIAFISVDGLYKAYVFLQVADLNSIGDYDLHEKRRYVTLEVACGMAKNKFPSLTTIIGIAIDAPKHHSESSESFLLFPCDEWDQNKVAHYTSLNKDFNFFAHETSVNYDKVFEFPN